MKRFRLLYLLALSTIMMLMACQSDLPEDQKNGGGQASQDSLVQVKLRIRMADPENSNVSTRAGWRDENATDEEMMYLWTVIIVNNATDAVQEIQACLPTGNYTSDAEEDNDREVDIVTELPLGTYRFYSFANIGASNLETLLGLPTGSVPVPSADDVIVKKALGDKIESPTSGNGETITDLGHIYPSGSNNNQQGVTPVDERTVTVPGNNFLIKNVEALLPNGLGSYGIPMSNVQTKEIVSDTKFDLILVRMMAKMEFRLFNVTGNDIKVKSLTLSGLTKNEADNLFILPRLANVNSMEYTHKDIRPNRSTPHTEDVTLTYPTGSELVVSKDYNTPTYNVGVNKYATVSFYVNESMAPDNADGLFQLTIELENDDYRYSFVSNYNSEWNYIARNDYRVIPIVLDDYKMELTPYDFPEIGVYPASVKTIDAAKHLYQMDFHDYGHFHLLPKVTHASGTEFIEFVADAPTTTPYTSTNWGLIDNKWEDSFKSYVDEKESAPYNLDYNSTTGQFYGKPGASGLPADNVYPTTMPIYLTDIDASENGDWPMLDVTSRWKPKPTDPNDMPYIFGQIAPQEAGADKKVFHDFRVYLYVTGATTPRVLTYRFYMHLKQDHATARHRTVSCK